ncbi:MAG: ThuA domain-containing protein [Armatimonadetes bacterium]|jgi:type 1 glutamine amidotransferase|nr:ThuA domain-containing protein [Armatimonadota bacterium]
MRIKLLVVLLLLSIPAWGSEVRQAPSKALMMVGGPHHDNPDLYPILKNFMEATGDFTVTISRDLDQFKADNIKNYDLIIMYTTRLTPTPDQEKGLLDFVAGGKGFVGIHCATDTFLESDAYWKMVGGRFTRHGNELFKVNITGKSHSIVRTMSAFEVKDETYCDDFHPESKLITLARRDKDSEPVAWVQYYGKGRVFINTLGHGREAFENPGFQQLVINGSKWATYRLNP